MLAAAMISAAVPAFSMGMLMMLAAHKRIIDQFSFQQIFYRFLRFTGSSAVNLDPGLGQSLLGSAANAAANQRIHTLGCQKACQGAVPASGRIHQSFAADLSLCHFIDLKLLGMAEMLKNTPVFIRYRYFHFSDSSAS